VTDYGLPSFLCGQDFQESEADQFKRTTSCTCSSSLDWLIFITQIIQYCRLLGSPTLVGKPINFISFFSFLSIHRAQQPRSGRPSNFGGSVVGNASTVGREISPTHPLTYTGQKSAKFGVVLTSLNFEPLAFENAARYQNAETKFLCKNDRPMSSPSLVKLSVVPHP